MSQSEGAEPGERRDDGPGRGPGREPTARHLRAERELLRSLQAATDPGEKGRLLLALGRLQRQAEPDAALQSLRGARRLLGAGAPEGQRIAVELALSELAAGRPGRARQALQRAPAVFDGADRGLDPDLEALLRGLNEDLTLLALRRARHGAREMERRQERLVEGLQLAWSRLSVALQAELAGRLPPLQAVLPVVIGLTGSELGWVQRGRGRSGSFGLTRTGAPLTAAQLRGRRERLHAAVRDHGTRLEAVDGGWTLACALPSLFHAEAAGVWLEGMGPPPQALVPLAREALTLALLAGARRS